MRKSPSERWVETQTSPELHQRGKYSLALACRCFFTEHLMVLSWHIPYRQGLRLTATQHYVWVLSVITQTTAALQCEEEGKKEEGSSFWWSLVEPVMLGKLYNVCSAVDLGRWEDVIRKFMAWHIRERPKEIFLFRPIDRKEILSISVPKPNNFGEIAEIRQKKLPKHLILPFRPKNRNRKSIQSFSMTYMLAWHIRDSMITLHWLFIQPIAIATWLTRQNRKQDYFFEIWCVLPLRIIYLCYYKSK